ncbi:MAG TPA: alpha/beta fold hydrolase [Streptosporangiaceae bacterium]
MPAVLRQPGETEPQACAAQDPGFLSQLTTDNIARDLNQIRLALHQPAISYLGLSWGTEFGAYYRSLFPGTVAHMWLDSVLTPDSRPGVRIDGDVAAKAQDFTRMAGWVARHDDSYRLGGSAAQVTAAVRRLQLSYDAAPPRVHRPAGRYRRPLDCQARHREQPSVVPRRAGAG